MITRSILDALASVLVPVGWTGAAIAVLCAVIAGVALARGAAGLCGGAAGVWIPATMLSGAAWIAQNWLPLAVSVLALGAMLTVGGVIHAAAGTRAAVGGAVAGAAGAAVAGAEVASLAASPAGERPGMPLPRATGPGTTARPAGTGASARPVRSHT